MKVYVKLTCPNKFLNHSTYYRTIKLNRRTQNLEEFAQNGAGLNPECCWKRLSRHSRSEMSNVVGRDWTYIVPFFSSSYANKK
jgi:hypothetical protein